MAETFRKEFNTSETFRSSLQDCSSVEIFFHHTIMITTNEKGFTLVELLLAITIMGIIGGATMPLLSTMLNANASLSDRSDIYQEGLLAMDRMTERVRRCTFLLIPNNHTPVRDILAVSGTINEDNDNYFNDPLFPKIDEDPKKQMTDDGKAGIENDEDPLNPFIYSFDSITNTLVETSIYDGTTTNLSTYVTAFTATYVPPNATHTARLSISFTLTGDDGKNITFFEYVYPRNILQKTGKRVR